MKNIKSKGFSTVEALLVVIAVTLVAGVGYYVYNSQQDKPVVKAQIPSGYVQYAAGDVSFVHPASWKTSDLPDLGSKAAFNDNSMNNINVYASKPRVYFSPDGDYFCQLEAGKWQNYNYVIGEAKSITVTKSENSSTCETLMVKRVVDGNVVYDTKGGNERFAKYQAVVETKSAYIVINHGQAYEPQIMSETERIELLKSVELKVQGAVDDLASAN